MKMSQWNLLFILALLTGCGDSSTSRTTNPTETTQVASATETNNSSSSGTVTTNTGVSDNNQTNSSDYQVILSTQKKISGYEIHLKFTKEIPLNSTLTLDNSFLNSTGKTVHNLGPDNNVATKEIKFGGFVVGGSNSTTGVSGEFVVLGFDLAQGQPSIIKQSCLDKDANSIDCDVKINHK